MKKGFTLIELLVVIGIIGILAAVLMGTFSGGSESARTARCLSNLRNLASACQSVGVEVGHYPLAGSVEVKEMKVNRGRPQFDYYEVDGWIGWNSRNAYANTPHSHQSSASWMVSMYSDDVDARAQALTNGAVWRTLGGNASVYVCPLHAKRKVELNPLFSYVMNSFFAWDTFKGSDGFLHGEVGSITYGRLKRADRRLLFAEIQFMEDAKFNLSLPVPEDTAGELTDCVLQHRGDKYAGTPESIGFNHKSGKTYHAHVAFADGHVEKLTYPKKGLSQTEAQELTEWLCEAIDYNFDGSRYEKYTN